jgi:hypothetical protein
MFYSSINPDKWANATNLLCVDEDGFSEVPCRSKLQMVNNIHENGGTSENNSNQQQQQQQVAQHLICSDTNIKAMIV